jgi:hypothetical protein
MLEKTEGVKKNGQSKDTSNITKTQNEDDLSFAIVLAT